MQISEIISQCLMHLIFMPDESVPDYQPRYLEITEKCAAILNEHSYRGVFRGQDIGVGFSYSFTHRGVEFTFHYFDPETDERIVSTHDLKKVKAAAALSTKLSKVFGTSFTAKSAPDVDYDGYMERIGFRRVDQQ